MTLRTQIRDGAGAAHLAAVSSANELIVTGFPGATPVFRSMAPGQAFNFFPPKIGNNLIITSVLFSTTTGPVINIYEASSPTSLTIDKTLINLDVASPSITIINFPFGGFLRVTEGEYLNATTTLATTRMTIIGFYKPVASDVI